MEKLAHTIRTKLQAERAAQAFADLSGEEIYIFPVGKGSAAWQIGYRFGYFKASEFSAYVNDGVKPYPETIKPRLAGVTGSK